MFADNWFLFLLIVMLVFAADGSINHTETAVLIAILMALSLSANCSDMDNAQTSFFTGTSAT